jgi:hypothetical protein
MPPLDCLTVVIEYSLPVSKGSDGKRGSLAAGQLKYWKGAKSATLQGAGPWHLARELLLYWSKRK